MVELIDLLKESVTDGQYVSILAILRRHLTDADYQLLIDNVKKIGTRWYLKHDFGRPRLVTLIRMLKAALVVGASIEVYLACYKAMKDQYGEQVADTLTRSCCMIDGKWRIIDEI